MWSVANSLEHWGPKGWWLMRPNIASSHQPARLCLGAAHRRRTPMTASKRPSPFSSTSSTNIDKNTNHISLAGYKQAVAEKLWLDGSTFASKHLASSSFPFLDPLSLLASDWLASRPPAIATGAPRRALWSWDWGKFFLSFTEAQSRAFSTFNFFFSNLQTTTTAAHGAVAVAACS